MPAWTLVYEGFSPEEERLREALCVLGNGYFCTRGAAEWADGNDVHYPGTYVAGGYNRLVTEIAGRPIENEDLVNMPNWLCLSFRVGDGSWFDLASAELLAYRQELHVGEGMLTRTLRVRDGEGRETALTSRRIVCMDKPHFAAIEMTITPANWSGPLTVRSALDGRVVNAGVARYRQLNNRHLEPLDAGVEDDGRIYIAVETSQSGLRVAEAARTHLFDDAGRPLKATVEKTVEAAYAAQTFTLNAREGETVTVEKVVALFTSRDRAISHPLGEAVAAVGRSGGFGERLRGHKVAWKQLWRRCDVVLDHRERIQMILRVHIFHLLQTASRNTVDLDVGIPARGWHGEAYRGHIFWDELFILPFFNYSLPELTHSLLRYRFRRLDEARAAAAEAGFSGAMFPWQSGADGREETQAMHLNPKSGRWLPDLSRNQRHVNIAITYNVWQYWQTTGNDGFMSIFGAEMLFEIARFWSSIAHYNPKRDRYEIHGVMGPDEYHEEDPNREGETGLHNNAYTNVMVAWSLDATLKALDSLLPYRREELRETLELTDEEISRWADMSRKMFVPFHDDGIISQFEGYEALKEFDWDGYRQKYGDIQRLDRILEAEGDSPNHYKLSKQADVLMLFYLFSEEEIVRIFAMLDYRLDAESLHRNIAYYLARTSHGSTLSNLVQSAVLSRFDRETSWKAFCEALESDISDVQGGTTAEGIHLGAMAGTVDLVQRIYTGLEIRHGVLFFKPHLPRHLGSLEFAIRYRGMWLDVRATASELAISPRADARIEPVRIGVLDKVYFLKPGYRRVFALD